MVRLTGIAPAYLCAMTASGEVEMVNSRGIYLAFENKRILLCDSSYGAVPNGISIADYAFIASRLQVGQPVQLRRRLLKFPFGNAVLMLQEAPQALYRCTPSIKKLQQALMLLLDSPGKGLGPLAAPLFGMPHGPLDLRCEMALPRIRGLINGLRTNDLQAIAQYTESLLGFGLGLTPSGDDVLAGLMYGLRHSPHRNDPGVAALTDRISTLADKRTNAVSATYLSALAQDAPFDALQAAWHDPKNKAPALLSIGSSSGSEMLLGLLLAGLQYKEV